MPAAARETPPAPPAGPGDQAAPEAPAALPEATAEVERRRAEARQIYGDAAQAFEAGDFAAAADGFRHANELVPSPHAEYWRAVSLDRMGRDLEALEAYETYLNDPGAEKVGAAPLLDAERRAKELLAKFAVVKLATTPPARVTVNGAQRGTTPVELRLVAGSHRVTLSADGYQPEELEVRAAAGQTLEQSLALAPVAPPPPPPKAALPSPAPARRDDSPPTIEQQDRTAGYVLLGLTGASALVGSYFGLKALGDRQSFEDHPSEERANDAERHALISDIGFGAAITFGVTALVVLTRSPESTEGRAALAEKEPADRRFQLAPLVSAKGGGAAARWRF